MRIWSTHLATKEWREHHANVNVLVDVVTGESLIISNPVKGKIETLNQHWVTLKNGLISLFLRSMTNNFHWMLHVIDLRQNCVYVLDSLRSKVNEDIHGVINVCWMIVFAVVLYGSVESVLFYMEVYAGVSGILVCIAGEIVIRFAIE
ncbi:hypothetical protein IC582_024101 [Cucumis melo]